VTGSGLSGVITLFPLTGQFRSFLWGKPGPFGAPRADCNPSHVSDNSLLNIDMLRRCDSRRFHGLFLVLMRLGQLSWPSFALPMLGKLRDGSLCEISLGDGLLDRSFDAAARIEDLLRSPDVQRDLGEQRARGAPKNDPDTQ